MAVTNKALLIFALLGAILSGCLISGCNSEPQGTTKELPGATGKAGAPAKAGGSARGQVASPDFKP